MKRIALFMALIVVLLLSPYLYHQYRLSRELHDEISFAHEQLKKPGRLHVDQTGYVQGVGARWVLPEQYINARLREAEPQRRGYIRTWKRGAKKVIAVSALGLDNRHHFANSYLVGFQPFPTDAVWVPLYTLAIKKNYQADDLQHSGLADVWQNSLQAFFLTRGDCEDHAIALADWLICLGKDARVVAGDYKGEGHAWVVLFHDSKAYVLEATDKRKIKEIRHYPAAGLAKGYHPVFQFNRTEFWVNTGSRFTTQYRGNHWELRSHFKKGAPSRDGT